MESPFSISLTKETQEEYQIKVVGKLDVETTPEFEEYIKDLFQKNPKNIKLDLEGLENIISSAIGSLLLLHDTIANKQKQLTIIKVNDKIKSIISIVGLDNIIIL